MKRTTLLWAAFVSATLMPWIAWLDLNAIALRFVQIRGHWPMCPSALPCHSRSWSDNDAMYRMALDPVYQRLCPPDWAVPLVLCLVLCSAPAWIILRRDLGKHLSPVARRVFLIAFVVGWAYLVLDPTRVVAWFSD